MEDPLLDPSFVKSEVKPNEAMTYAQYTYAKSVVGTLNPLRESKIYNVFPILQTIIPKYRKKKTNLFKEKLGEKKSSTKSSMSMAMLRKFDQVVT